MISIIIPCYNEAENIVRYPKELFYTIEDIRFRTGENFEFIFVDDGSTDGTYHLLMGVMKGVGFHNQIIRFGQNAGMGCAIREGIKASRGSAIITMDADLTFRPADIVKLIMRYHWSEADCVSGSPYLNGGCVEDGTPIRLLMSNTVNTMYRLVLGADITCVSPIFRIYRKSALDSLELTSNGFEINAEIMSKLILAGKKITEVPVPLLKRKHGKSNIDVKKEIRNYLVLLVKIVRVKWFGGAW